MKFFHIVLLFLLAKGKALQPTLKDLFCQYFMRLSVGMMTVGVSSIHLAVRPSSTDGHSDTDTVTSGVYHGLEVAG